MSKLSKRLQALDAHLKQRNAQPLTASEPDPFTPTDAVEVPEITGPLREERCECGAVFETRDRFDRMCPTCKGADIAALHADHRKVYARGHSKYRKSATWRD